MTYSRDNVSADGYDTKHTATKGKKMADMTNKELRNRAHILFTQAAALSETGKKRSEDGRLVTAVIRELTAKASEYLEQISRNTVKAKEANRDVVSKSKPKKLHRGQSVHLGAIDAMRDMLDRLESETQRYSPDDKTRSAINLGIMAANDAIAEVLIVAVEDNGGEI